MTHTHAGVQGADCAQEIGGVCYSCPEGYPNNVFDDGKCLCGSNNGEQVACIPAAGASAGDSIGGGVTQVVNSSGRVPLLFVLLVGVVGAHVM